MIKIKTLACIATSIILSASVFAAVPVASNQNVYDSFTLRNTRGETFNVDDDDYFYNNYCAAMEQQLGAQAKADYIQAVATGNYGPFWKKYGGLSWELFTYKNYWGLTLRNSKPSWGTTEILLWQNGVSSVDEYLAKTGKAPAFKQPTPATTHSGVTKDNFDYKRYADTYADLKKAFGYNKDQLWNHYANFGVKEGRQAYAVGSAAAATAPKATASAPAASANITKDNFDYKRYADTYADLKKAFGYNKDQLWNHYSNFGIKEGRKAYSMGAAAAAPAASGGTAEQIVQQRFAAYVASGMSADAAFEKVKSELPQILAGAIK
ncbi:MAG: hypothetical protein IJR00_12395 [Lachnospiraceae bacterium]|nr:hypothetical protein [Lachnospiraceae bacterium]